MRSACSAEPAYAGAAICARMMSARAAPAAEVRRARREVLLLLTVLVFIKRPSTPTIADARAGLYGPKVPAPIVCLGSRRQTPTHLLLGLPQPPNCRKLRVG